MKMLIQTLLRKKLNEVSFHPHYYERAEDRVWGNKPEGPASINAPAYEGDFVNKRDLLAYDTELKSLITKHNIPLTKEVNYILSLIDEISDIDFKVNKGVAIKLWSSGVVHTGKDQNPPGGTLLAIVRNNTVMNIQWQPNKDVNIGGGKVTDVSYILNAEDLISYSEENNKKVINTEDILKITGKFVEPKTKEKVFMVNNAKYVVADKNTGDLKQKNGDKIIQFDDLPVDVQTQVLDFLT